MGTAAKEVLHRFPGGWLHNHLLQLKMLLCILETTSI